MKACTGGVVGRENERKGVQGSKIVTTGQRDQCYSEKMDKSPVKAGIMDWLIRRGAAWIVFHLITDLLLELLELLDKFGLNHRELWTAKMAKERDRRETFKSKVESGVQFGVP